MNQRAECEQYKERDWYLLSAAVFFLKGGGGGTEEDLRLLIVSAGRLVPLSRIESHGNDSTSMTEEGRDARTFKTRSRVPSAEEEQGGTPPPPTKVGGKRNCARI